MATASLYEFTILSVMNYPHQHNQLNNNIAKYMAAMGVFDINYGLKICNFRDKCISLFLKEIRLNSQLNPTTDRPIDIHLTKIVQRSNFHKFSTLIKHYILLLTYII